MLRLEQGFDESVFHTDDERLAGYTEHHRHVMPALATYDLFAISDERADPIERLTEVIEGSRRSATLAFERDNLQHACQSVGWIATREALDITHVTPDEPWRLARRDDPHARFPGASIWTATRNLARPSDGTSKSDTRVRERYTLAADRAVGEDDVRSLFIDTDSVPKDILLATATVYAINKKIEKRTEDRYAVNMADFPELARELGLL